MVSTLLWILDMKVLFITAAVLLVGATGAPAGVSTYISSQNSRGNI